MQRPLFGTESFYRSHGSHPLTPDVIVRIAQAAGAQSLRATDRARVIIGRDTSASGGMTEAALVAGFTSVGLDVCLAGVVPSAAVGALTISLRAALGVMISAGSGIRFVGADGAWLSAEDEAAIERGARAHGTACSGRFGQSTAIRGADHRYAEVARRSVPPGTSLRGLRVVLDAANGAAHRIGPDLLWELGADVIEVASQPDGHNIDVGCGVLDTAACQRAVVESGADLGIALDGDADRVRLIDERGRLVDADQHLALLAERTLSNRHGAKPAVVATVLSNGGLDRFMSERGLDFQRADDSARAVMSMMRTRGARVGGDPEGHLVLADVAHTPDGLTAALQALAVLSASRQRASEALLRFVPLCQARRRITIGCAAHRPPGADLAEAIADYQPMLGREGRIVLRPAAFTPEMLLLVEGHRPAALTRIADELCEIIRSTSDRPDPEQSWAAEIEACTIPHRLRAAAHSEKGTF